LFAHTYWTKVTLMTRLTYMSLIKKNTNNWYRGFWNGENRIVFILLSHSYKGVFLHIFWCRRSHWTLRRDFYCQPLGWKTDGSRHTGRCLQIWNALFALKIVIQVDDFVFWPGSTMLSSLQLCFLLCHVKHIVLFIEKIQFKWHMVPNFYWQLHFSFFQTILIFLYVGLVSLSGSLSQLSSRWPGFDPRRWHQEAPPLAFLVNFPPYTSSFVSLLEYSFFFVLSVK